MSAASPLPKSKAEIESEERLHERLGPVLYWAWAATKTIGLVLSVILLAGAAGFAGLAAIAGGAQLLMWIGMLGACLSG